MNNSKFINLPHNHKSVIYIILIVYYIFINFTCIAYSNDLLDNYIKNINRMDYYNTDDFNMYMRKFVELKYEKALPLMFDLLENPERKFWDNMKGDLICYIYSINTSEITINRVEKYIKSKYLLKENYEKHLSILKKEAEKLRILYFILIYHKFKDYKLRYINYINDNEYSFFDKKKLIEFTNTVDHEFAIELAKIYTKSQSIKEDEIVFINRIIRKKSDRY